MRTRLKILRSDHTVYLRVLSMISEQKAIISLYIYWFIFVTETECVLCTVRTEALNTMWLIPGYNSKTEHGPHSLSDTAASSKYLPTISFLRPRLHHSGFEPQKSLQPKYAPPPQTYINKARCLVCPVVVKPRRHPLA